MDNIDAYYLINRRFIEFAEEQGIHITPTLGQRANIVRLGLPGIYHEVFGHPDARAFQIFQDPGGDAVWASFWPPELKGEIPFMKVGSPPELEESLPTLWAMRCAWFNFAVSVEEAERDVLRLEADAQP